MQPTGYGISAPQAWDRRTSCSLVATVDTGAQYTHPDLKPSIWHNAHEIDDNGIDDDRNGWVDDYYGVNVQQGSGNGDDADGHGTHVAGIVAGRANNAAGIAGTCWSGLVMPVRFMNAKGKGSTSDAITAIDTTGGLASFSDYGPKSVDLAAPGDTVLSTYPTSTYKLLSGTSMAAPMVAAAAAMLRESDPQLTYAQIRSILKASADPDPALAGKLVTVAG